MSAPASTETRDGLGPVYNATGCSACHFNDGRAAPPEDGLGPFVGLLLRLSTPDGAPDPTYGGQLQDLAIPGVTPDGVATIDTAPVTMTYADGSTVTLQRPTYHVEWAHGAPAPGLLMSPRIAPQMIGLGLLEAIDPADLEAAADPHDADGDGVSGRVQRHVDPRTGAPMIGRFGWKGDAPTVEAQAAGAFNGDLGLTTALFPVDDCGRDDCLLAPNGGDPEVDDTVLDRVVVYSRALAVPARRAVDDPEVLLGRAAFYALTCDLCHTPSFTTGDFAPLPELSGQRVWPYTDLLLHDMGPELADRRPLGDADGQEWKTPPLWGLGLVPEVNGHSRYLHDGRARSLEEAILWHGGEAEAARDAFLGAPADERAALVRFLEDL